MSSLVQPTAVVALANVRLRDASEGLARKLDATTVSLRTGGVGRTHFGDTERRILGLVRAAEEMIGGQDQAAVPRTSALFPGPSRYAVLGSAAFELTSYADAFSEAGDWRAGLLRRGTPDPDRSLVVVPTTSFATTAGAAMVATAGLSPAARRDTARQRAEAVALGISAAVAHGVVFGPVQRGERQRLTSRRWSRHEPGSMLSAADGLVLSRLVGGDDPGSQWRRWWPSVEEAQPYWDDVVSSLGTSYSVDGPGRAQGWPAFEAGLLGHRGAALDRSRLATGYERLLADTSPWGMGTWFGVLTPFLLSPTISLLFGLLLPHGKRFFSPNDGLTDRSFTELYSLSSSISSVAPFVGSMVMWANLPEHTDAFGNALGIFLGRAALFGGWLPTIGTEAEDPSPVARWLLAGGMLGADVYALVRALKARGGPQPGNAVVFGMQTIPGILALTTLVQGALIKGVVALTKEAGGSDDTASALAGVTLGLTALGTWLGVGLPLAHALAKGGGWMSWFRTTGALSLQGALAAAEGGREPSGVAALFDDSTLWHDPATAAPALADLRYPTAGRGLVKVWRDSGAPDLEISYGAHLIRIRNGTTVTDVPVGPGRRSVADLVAALVAVPGVHARPIDDVETYDLPWPATLGDPTDATDPRPASDAPERTAFTRLPTSEHDAIVLRHSSGADLTTGFGLAAPGGSRFDGVRLVPQATLGDVEDTALGAAADLTVLLGLGVASQLRDVVPPTTAGGAPLPAVDDVQRVFRNWNLDDRRLNEWRMLVAGGAVPDDAPPAPDRIEGERVAHALGWVPLWRAWLRIASDPTQDASAARVASYTPSVVAADGSTFRPTNAQLSAGIRYLFDLPA